jgi:hypothetical protein
MALLTYQRIVVGYHGCDAALAEKVAAGRAKLNPSSNDYDWLGDGIYFWEHGPRRAFEWAMEQARIAGRKVERPSVLAARIDLGVCLDLLDTANTRLLGKWYREFSRFVKLKGSPMPCNREAPGTRLGDKVLRFRDCAVLKYAITRIAETKGIRYQSVRGVFLEGEPSFPGSKIALKSHIQIAVRDPACIVAFLRPKPEDYEAEV